MTLEALAERIAAAAKAKGEAITETAREQAKEIASESAATNAAARDQVVARAKRESDQLSVEVVASARQANQKRELIARREVLEETWQEVQEKVGAADLAGRTDILNSLLKEAKSAGGDMILHPVNTDRKALTGKGFDLGDDVDGLGGFILESSDGSILLDYRFDGRLQEVWEANLGAVNKLMFGN